MEAVPRPRPFEQPRAALLERAGLRRLDPLMLIAGLGLIAFSIYTLGVVTTHDVPGNPYYYVVRQSIYAVVGIALMFAVARIDYSRFRELRVGIYTAMIGLSCSSSCSARRPADRAAGSICRSSPSSPPSSAR